MYKQIIIDKREYDKLISEIKELKDINDGLKNNVPVLEVSQDYINSKWCGFTNSIYTKLKGTIINPSPELKFFIDSNNKAKDRWEENERIITNLKEYINQIERLHYNRINKYNNKCSLYRMLNKI